MRNNPFSLSIDRIETLAIETKVTEKEMRRLVDKAPNVEVPGVMMVEAVELLGKCMAELLHQKKLLKVALDRS